MHMMLPETIPYMFTITGTIRQIRGQVYEKLNMPMMPMTTMFYDLL